MSRILRSSGNAATLGYQIGFGILIYTGLGYLLDRWLGTLPWFTLVGAMIGLASVIALIYKITKEAQEVQRVDEARMKASGKSYTKIEEDAPELDDWDKDDWKKKDDWDKEDWEDSRQ